MIGLPTVTRLLLRYNLPFVTVVEVDSSMSLTAQWVFYKGFLNFFDVNSSRLLTCVFAKLTLYFRVGVVYLTNSNLV